MDIVYICRDGDNEELRYSIRSVVKNLKHDNIWVVGGKPDWYIGNHIPVYQNSRKYDNARKNLKVVSLSDEISENFILMNDDFFIMKPMEHVEIWHGGSLWDKSERRMQLEPYSTYGKYLRETYKTIKHLGIDEPLDYELHTPLPTTKTSIAEALKHEGLWRSISANVSGIGGDQHEDVKLYTPGSLLHKSINNLDHMTYMSCDDRSFNILLNSHLLSAFPNKTKYES